MNHLNAGASILPPIMSTNSGGRKGAEVGVEVVEVEGVAGPTCSQLHIRFEGYVTPGAGLEHEAKVDVDDVALLANLGEEEGRVGVVEVKAVILGIEAGAHHDVAVMPVFNL